MLAQDPIPPSKLPGAFRMLLLRLWRFSTSADYRWDALWRLIARPAGLFQPYGSTSEDRYPELFRRVQALITDGPDRRLLSFGCSTGEEVLSLRRYFPEARITGIDINPRRIGLARRRLARMGGDGRIEFAVAGGVEHLENTTFDAIFCLALFRHEKLKIGVAPRADHLIRFADFERAVTDLARCLKPGGLLVLRHAVFRFRDTAIAEKFDVVGRLDPETPIYDRNDRLLPDIAEDQAIFRLRPTSSAVGPNQKE